MTDKRYITDTVKVDYVFKEGKHYYRVSLGVNDESYGKAFVVDEKDFNPENIKTGIKFLFKSIMYSLFSIRTPQEELEKLRLQYQHTANTKED